MSTSGEHFEITRNENARKQNQSCVRGLTVSVSVSVFHGNITTINNKVSRGFQTLPVSCERGLSDL